MAANGGERSARDKGSECLRSGECEEGEEVGTAAPLSRERVRGPKTAGPVAVRLVGCHVARSYTREK